MNNANKTYKTYSSNMTYKTYMSYFVLFVLLFSFFALPAKPARAATLSRPPTNLGLVGYWPMDEGVGTRATDFSGNGNHGDINGTPVWANGKHGKALSTNGNTAVIPNAPRLNNASQLTVSIWLYARSEVVGYAVHPFNKWGSGTGDANFVLYYFGTTSGMNRSVGFYANAGGGWTGVSATYTVNLNTWYHIALVYNSSIGGQLYINGQTVGGLTASGVLATNTGDVNIGNLDGLVDDARIYNRALSATEITKLYQSGAVKLKQVSNQGLVGYWPFNEGRGIKAGDSSGRGNSGTITGASWTNGKRGGALNFNGSSDYIDLGTNLGIVGDATMSISAWFKTTSASAEQAISVIGDTTTLHNFALYLNGGGAGSVSAEFNGGNGYKSETGVYSVNRWYHLVATKTPGAINSTTKLYLNGVELTPASSSTETPSINVSLNYIGMWSNGGLSKFSGIIDDVRIYNRALSATEIQSLYKSGEKTENVNQNNKLTNGLVGLWSFNGQDVSGSVAYDRSSSGNNGTITGAQVIGGKVGQALKFPAGASTNNVLISSFASITSTITTSAWIYPTSNPEERFTIIQGQSPNGFYMSLNSDGSLQTYWYGKSVEGYHSSGAGTVPLNTWSHVAVVWNTDGPYLYVNGVLKYNTASTGTGAAGTVINIGAETTARQFIGKIDEVRVYNRALSADEVKQLYNMGK